MTEMKSVAAHYSSDGLVERIVAALGQNGLESGSISAQQLEALDQFHSGGLLTTAELAKKLRLTPEMKVLDVGSGLGGPSRYLAQEYGCHVEGIDLSNSFVEAATYLAGRVGLQDKVAYRQANALSLPFRDGEFYVVWTQHVAMNIADRKGFYSEIRRVLKPGGQLAVFDVVRGDAGPLIYPVPWAIDPATSFLQTPTEMKSMLESLGFEAESWVDNTADALLWFRNFAQRQKQANAVGSPIGLNLAMGEDFKLFVENLRRNLEEGRAQLLEGIVRRL